MILIAFGTRPEWIKLAPVINKIRGTIPYRLVFTGQHTDLLDSIDDNIISLKIKIN